MRGWKIPFYVVLTYLGLVVHGSVGLRLDFLLLVLVVFALSENRQRAVAFGFLLGFLLDCFSPRLFGLNSLLFVALGYALGSVGEHIYSNRMHLVASLIFVVTLLHVSVYILVSSSATFGSVFFPTVLGAAFYNTVTGIPLFYLTSRLCPRTL
jgi:rod shape-determining protein MreD